MPRFLACCGSFLLAVLWMDLMFDVQVRGQPAGPLPEPVLASLAGYYARVTTGAFPMNRLIGGVMLVTLLGVSHQLVRGSGPPWLRGVAALSAGVPIGLALLRIFPNAVELGQRAGSLEQQSVLARAIFVEHVVCAVGIAVFVAIQLVLGRPRAICSASRRGGERS